MTQDELNIIIENHKHWLYHDCDGWENMRANLWDADLSGADLHEANIRNADLTHVNLSRANLNYVDLSGADLRYAKLCGANLRGADLRDANLSYANLHSADLTCSILECANLTHANLSGADLHESVFRWANLHATSLLGANLEDTSLYGAILEGSNLSGANLKGANLNNANLEGALLDKSEKVRAGEILKEKILGYKKTLEGKIITLEIPKGAIVFSINNDKCRTNKAKVVECDGVQHSRYDSMFKYVEGKEIEIEDFDLMYNNECGAGIHFFKTKTEAEEYDYF